jgi:hypothetical protein
MVCRDALIMRNRGTVEKKWGPRRLLYTFSGTIFLGPAPGMCALHSITWGPNTGPSVFSEIRSFLVRFPVFHKTGSAHCALWYSIRTLGRVSSRSEIQSFPGTWSEHSDVLLGPRFVRVFYKTQHWAECSSVRASMISH